MDPMASSNYLNRICSLTSEYIQFFFSPPSPVVYVQQTTFSLCSYLIPLPDEAAEGAPWSIFSSDETIGVILTRKVSQPAQVLQEPLEDPTLPAPLVLPLHHSPLIEEILYTPQ